VDTLTTRRTTFLLLEASRSGGNIQGILEAIYDHVNTMELVEKERKSKIKPFISVSYIAFAIFVAVGILIFKVLFPQMAQIWKQAPGGFLGQAIDIDAITRVFYHMANIEAFVGGLVAGKMGEASTGAGLKHSLILMVAAYLVFYFYVW
jgi:flagellar protein FlaJ